MRVTKVLYITDKRSLLQILKIRNGSVAFRLESMTLANNQLLEERVNYLINDCGCEGGRIALRKMLPFSIIISLALGFFFNVSYGLQIAVLFALLLLSGGIGKIYQIEKNKAELSKIVLKTLISLNLTSYAKSRNG